MDRWKSLILTHIFKEAVILFNNIFLGIYFFKMTENSIITVSLYYFIFYFMSIPLRYVFSIMINSNRVIKMYRLALFINLIVPLILILLKDNIVNYIYLFALFYAATQMLYWTSYEVIIKDINKNENFHKYFMYDNIITNIQSIILPAFFGIVLDKYSYLVVFFILSIFSLFAFILSFKINQDNIECYPINIKKFFLNIKDKIKLKYLTLQSIYDGLTSGGIADFLATIIIFDKISNEAFIGNISSIIGIICVILTLIFQKKLNSTKYSKFVILITILLFLITIPIAIKPALILIILYKLLVGIGDICTNIQGNAVTFKSIDDITDIKMKVDYLWFMEMVLNIGRCLCLLVIIVTSIIFKNIDSLTPLFIFFSLFYILRAIVIYKIQKI